MASASVYTDNANIRYTKEWIELIKRDYNHPCIVAWVPFNESWGIPDVYKNKQQQSHTLALYYLIKSLDFTRLVIGNDGWELTKTDICAIHNYSHGTVSDEKKRAFFVRTMNELPMLLSPAPAGRNIFADGFSYEDQPILITECGGIHYNTSDSKGWGYTSASGLDDYIEQYKFVIETILSSEKIFGFCYTQLTDVEQETNGLLTCQRKPKCDLTKIREINETFRHNIVLVSDNTKI